MRPQVTAADVLEIGRRQDLGSPLLRSVLLLLVFELSTRLDLVRVHAPPKAPFAPMLPSEHLHDELGSAALESESSIGGPIPLPLASLESLRGSIRT